MTEPKLPAAAHYVFVFRGGRDPNISPAELGAHLAAWSTWLAGLRAAGHVDHRGGGLLDTGKTLRGKDQTLTDGPYAEAKDLVTGTLPVRAVDIDAALALARGCPIFVYGGSVEVRPLAPPLPLPE